MTSARNSLLERQLLLMNRGPYQNNGASPWYTEATLGTPGQKLKFALDSGTNQIWITSSLCSPSECRHYSNGRFELEKSSTFVPIDDTPKNYNFGPWGEMTVEVGRDFFGLPGGATVPLDMNLASKYSGDQFAELDWDGGIGLPSGSQFKQAESSFIMQELMNSGLISPDSRFVSIDWDGATALGSCDLGGYDEHKVQDQGHIFMPWSPYTRLPGVEYLWTTSLGRYMVGGVTVARDVQFALDSGSSRFKGDDDIMNQTLSLIQQMGAPDITMEFNGGVITVPSDIYNVTIQAGSKKGQTLPQFNPLGLAGLVLVGSVLMEHCYTIFEYTVEKKKSGFFLVPEGTWIFNKPGGRKIITRSSSSAFAGGPKDVSRR